jgi:hypothetical protein
MRSLERDLVAAAGAETELVRVDAPERRAEPAALGPPVRGGRLRHRLLLHGIHAGQATDALLVEGDGRGRVAVGIARGLGRGEARLQQPSQFLAFGIGHRVLTV